MHSTIDNATIATGALYIAWAIEPIHPDRIHGGFRVVGFGVQKLHNSAEVVRITGWFTNEIYMIWSQSISREKVVDEFLVACRQRIRSCHHLPQARLSSEMPSISQKSSCWIHGTCLLEELKLPAVS